MSTGKVKKIQRAAANKNTHNCSGYYDEGGLLDEGNLLPGTKAAARDEHEQLFDLLKRSQAAAREEIFFPWAAGFPWGLTRTIVRLVSQAARRSPNPIQGLLGAARRIYVYIGYAARYPEQLWGLIPIPIRCPIPMITRTIHRFIFLAACCAPNLPWQRPDNPNNLSGYARGLRFSELESPR